jgi:hypothetical protein
MESTDDMQKSSTINFAKYYNNNDMLPLYLSICNLVEDLSIFYIDLNNQQNIRSNRVKEYYKYVTKFQ